MITEPRSDMAHPNFPNTPSLSFRKYDPRTALRSPVSNTHTWHKAQTQTHPIRTLNAPKGVTRIAGAKAYAAKLAISPRTTAGQLISLALEQKPRKPRTSDNTSPPQRTFQIRETVSLKAMSFGRLHQTLSHINQLNREVQRQLFGLLFS